MIKLILLIIIIFCTLHTQACRITRKINEKEKALADTVFMGHLTKYNYKNKIAVIEYKVIQTIRGEKKKNWSIVFAQNINVAVPQTMKAFQSKYGLKSIIGIRKKSGSQPDFGSLINAPKEYKDKPILVQSVCSEPYLEKI